jgi:hypothetical protein
LPSKVRSTAVGTVRLNGGETIMNGKPTTADIRRSRSLFMILSPRSLSYATKCVESLFAKAAEHLEICFMTDSAADKGELTDLIGSLPNSAGHRWRVVDASDAEVRANEQWASLPNLRTFRRGHPCWRKVTDPLLFSGADEEMVILDPDLYFPNRFTFEPTPKAGVRLMWQQPNCMLPPSTVYTALSASIALARHVDIGVAQWRANQDLEWFDWMIGKLGGVELPRVMHVESVVWSALAMRLGGGHLDPERWRCWRRTQLARILLKAGVSGVNVLRGQPFSQMKCFHAGGEAKWWLADAQRAGLMDQSRELLDESRVLPFVELTRLRFDAEQSVKVLLQKLGYYRVFFPSTN